MQPFGWKNGVFFVFLVLGATYAHALLVSTLLAAVVLYAVHRVFWYYFMPATVDRSKLSCYDDASAVIYSLHAKYNRKLYPREVVVSLAVDNCLQDIFDLIERDFFLNWYRNIGKDEVLAKELVNKLLWEITEQLVTRLSELDFVSFMANDVVDLLVKHFKELRLSDRRNKSVEAVPFPLHPCLKDAQSEREFLMKISDVFVLCLLPGKELQCSAYRRLLVSVIASTVLGPGIDRVCDPDFINHTFVSLLVNSNEHKEPDRREYLYAETYERFIGLISSCQEVESLKKIRQHIIAEIMQASMLLAIKDMDKSTEVPDLSTKLSKRALLLSRNLKRYLNQCQIAKAQCEKRIVALGGPDYRLHCTPLVRRTLSRRRLLSRTFSMRVLSLREVLDKTLARSYLMQYLHKRNAASLLNFWIAVEQIKNNYHTNTAEVSMELYTRFVVPSSPEVVKLDPALARSIERFAFEGLGDLSCFFEAQSVAYRALDQNHYQAFLLSKDYIDYVCQLESAVDFLSSRSGEEANTVLDSSDVFAMSGRTSKAKGRAQDTGHARQKLLVIGQQLTAKAQALELGKRSLAVNNKDISKLESDILLLADQKRHLELLLERAALWSRRSGNWSVAVTNCQRSQDLVVFFVEVSHHRTSRRPGRGPTAGQTIGWAVSRSLSDFENLRSHLQEVNPELRFSSGFTFKSDDLKSCPSAVPDNLIAAAENFLRDLLVMDSAHKMEELFQFLACAAPFELQPHQRSSSSSDQGLRFLSLPRKQAGSSGSVFDDQLDNISTYEDPDAPPGVSNVVQSTKDSIAGPLYTLIGEVFELKGAFKWLRKTLIAFVQATFGRTINRHILEITDWLCSEQMVLYCLQSFASSWWPNNQLAAPALPRTNLEKLRTREKARTLLLDNTPDVLQNLVGSSNAELGISKIFEALQDHRTNKHLVFGFLEMATLRMFPEVRRCRTGLDPASTT